ncbi:MAG TPA: ABC transporter substrate-binding protein [Chloroflexota bacterium]|jgi:putative ABC transport system substrate-binding protein|nr:ABC transporter substrate-binding protein [Chloroflexota bacterium]
MTRWRRRQVIVGLAASGVACGGLAIGGLASATRQPDRLPRIGYLGSDSKPGLDRLAALLQGLRDLGYVDGQTIAIERGLSQDQTGATFVDMAAKLLGGGVQVIVTSSTPALVAAAQATQSVPIVAAGPNRRLIDIGLVSSLARPGGNVTGVDNDPRLDAKGVELLHETIPGTVRIGYLRNPATLGATEQLTRAQEAARLLGLELFDLQVSAPDDIDAAFDRADALHIGGLIVSTDFLFGDPSGWRVLSLALKHQLPAIYTQTAGYVDQGGLMAYAADYSAFHRRAATFVDKLLRGANPAELPVEQAMTIDFAINLKSAQALGLTIPEHVLLQASALL